MQVCLLSLAEAKERRERLLQRGLPRAWVTHFQSGLDQRQTPQQELEALPLYQRLAATYQRPLLPGELGCLQSHLAAVTAFARQEGADARQEGADHDWLLILEDDVVPLTPNFLPQLELLVTRLKQSCWQARPLVCHLGPLPRQERSSLARRLHCPSLAASGLQLFEQVDSRRSLWRAHAYLINRAAAKSYLQAEDAWAWLADDWLGIKQGLGLQLLFTRPRLFGQDDDQASCIALNEQQAAVRSGIRLNQKKAWPLQVARQLRRGLSQKLARGRAMAWRWLPARRIF